MTHVISNKQHQNNEGSNQLWKVKKNNCLQMSAIKYYIQY